MDNSRIENILIVGFIIVTIVLGMIWLNVRPQHHEYTIVAFENDMSVVDGINDYAHQGWEVVSIRMAVTTGYNARGVYEVVFRR